MSTGLGTVIDWSMSGYIIEYIGWHYAFYIVAVILGIHLIFWLCVVYDSPMNHPRISTTEKEFILSKLGTTVEEVCWVIYRNVRNFKIFFQKPWPPLKSMLLSLPIWALVIFHYGYVYSQYIFLTAMPKYLSEVGLCENFHCCEDSWSFDLIKGSSFWHRTNRRSK